MYDPAAYTRKLQRMTAEITGAGSDAAGHDDRPAAAVLVHVIEDALHQTHPCAPGMQTHYHAGPAAGPAHCHASTRTARPCIACACLTWVVFAHNSGILSRALDAQQQTAVARIRTWRIWR